jgi:hypothetical protein
LDQPLQRCTHRVVDIGIGEAALELQPRNNPLKEDAALLKRYAVGGGPDRPKLRIGEREHAAIVFAESDPLMTVSAEAGAAP